jgi:osmotically-inducible protein OsmY
MQERGGGQLRRTDPRSGERGRSSRYDEYVERGGTSMTSGAEATPERQQDEWGGRESGEGWTGYVVPYRYYGPGYRGVGYYSVLYQGSGERDESQTHSQSDESGSRYGPGSGWNNRADARVPQSAGGFAGRGPKGYQRSDERLGVEVSDRLMADDQIDASDIEVDVRNGEVTLTGTVPDRWAKRRAEDCAERVMGVRDVMNQVRVQGASTERGGRAAEASDTTMPAGSRGNSLSSPPSGGKGAQSGESEATGTNGSRRAATSRR